MYLAFAFIWRIIEDCWLYKQTGSILYYIFWFHFDYNLLTNVLKFGF